MKKILNPMISLILCACVVLFLSACGQKNNDAAADHINTAVSNNNTGNNTEDSADSIPEKSVTGDSDILVAYFSWSGNTSCKLDFR